MGGSHLELPQQLEGVAVGLALWPEHVRLFRVGLDDLGGQILHQPLAEGAEGHLFSPGASPISCVEAPLARPSDGTTQ